MTAALSYRAGVGVWGTPVMKFTLVYDGPLPSSGNSRKKKDAKWEIRNKLHPQLKDLWASHPTLRQIETDGRYFPIRGGAHLTQVHHQHPGPVLPSAIALEEAASRGRREVLDLCEPIDKHGAWFRPLIRESFALHCGLKILFLRKEPPGKVYQGGDIDGRIKTLMDALTMPQHIEQVLEKIGDRLNPVYCLLEDDSLVSGLHVESERLLTDQDQATDYARLTIEVDVRVRQAMIYNQSFLG
jgi:hypothetical protein